MPIDTKYGRVIVERGDIGGDEPVVVFRAQDRLLPAVLDAYADLCREAGSPANHIQGIQWTRDFVTAWQADNHTQTPRSQSHTAD